MWAGGLYYPFMRIRNPNWLKASVLYWDTMRRFRPRSYSPRDSPVSSQLADAGFLRYISPEPYADGVSYELQLFISEYAGALRHQFSISALLDDRRTGPGWGLDAPSGADRRLGWIHSRKMGLGFASFLQDEGLGVVGRGSDSEWVGLHPTLAAAYMLALVGECAEREQLEPATDNPDQFLSPAYGVESAIRLLTSGVIDPRNADLRHDMAGFAMLAMEYALPKNMSEISVDQLLATKDTLQEELAQFRGFVATQRQELGRLAGIQDPAIYAEAFTDHMRSQISEPLRQLEHGLRLCGLETARSVLTVQTFAPPALAAGASEMLHLSPVVATASGITAIAGTAWWQYTDARRQQIANSPVGYLLSVNRSLSPRTIIGRRARMLSGLKPRAAGLWMAAARRCPNPASSQGNH
jgi:Family of unknown function (DUF6236)